MLWNNTSLLALVFYITYYCKIYYFAYIKAVLFSLLLNNEAIYNIPIMYITPWVHAHENAMHTMLNLQLYELLVISRFHYNFMAFSRPSQ